MRIEVHGEDGINPQARTYAEYRVFAALTRHADAGRIRHARVILRRVPRLGDPNAVMCAVTVALEGADLIRIRTTGSHPYAAINRAVECLTMAGAATRRAGREDEGVLPRTGT